MEYQKLDQKSYKIHTIKTNRLKTTRIEMVFRKKITDKSISKYTFLASILNESSKKYPSRRLVTIKSEELYRAYYYAYANKVGNALNLVFTLDFINPEYIEDKNYLKDTISFFFDMFTKPNAKNKEFLIEPFNIVKNEILLDIESINENPEKKAINEALLSMDKDSISSLRILGTKEEVEKITPENLYKTYEEFMNSALVDLFVIGNTNMDNIVKEIKNNYKNHHMRTGKIDYYIENKTTKKVKIKTEESDFIQSQLVVLYNTSNLTKEEKEITFHLFNYILGSGGLSSKLYQYVREQNGYCYRISSMYFKYDNLLCVVSSLAKENINNTIKLIDKSIKEMQKGIFSEDDLQDAKKNILASLNINKNNPSSILSTYEFKEFLGNYTTEEKIEAISKITKKDVINVAKKISKNTIYVLSEVQNEGN